MAAISIIILTKNEEKDLLDCLQALTRCDDIHVLDSGSTDNTIDVAKQYGATVSYNEFKSFGNQRNFALENLELKYNWILFLDADEVINNDFYNSVKVATETAVDTVAGFYCCWKQMLEGRWLKYSDNFPKWQFRLMRKGRARFTDFGHGQKEGWVNGSIEYIKEPYLHNAFSKGWSYWIERHNKYSSQEAVARIKDRPPVKNIFASHASVRNPALKSWLSTVPGWPLLRFVQAYFFNLGFLEGSQGFIYCMNMAYYEFLIQIKMRELRNQHIKAS